jgi:ornithine--oxo-acid transaminase
MGAYFMDGLRSIVDDRVTEVRGRGLLIGMEFKPEAGGARQYCEKLMGAGILCKETHDHIIRFAPPLVISRDDVDWALETIKKTIF